MANSGQLSFRHAEMFDTLKASLERRTKQSRVFLIFL